MEENEGLPNEVVYGMLDDGAGSLDVNKSGHCRLSYGR